MTRREERERRAEPARSRDVGRGLIVAVLFTGAGAAIILGLVPNEDATNPFAWMFLGAGILLFVIYAKTR